MKIKSLIISAALAMALGTAVIPVSASAPTDLYPPQWLDPAMPSAVPVEANNFYTDDFSTDTQHWYKWTNTKSKDANLFLAQPPGIDYNLQLTYGDEINRYWPIVNEAVHDDPVKNTWATQYAHLTIGAGETIYFRAYSKEGLSNLKYWMYIVQN